MLHVGADDGAGCVLVARLLGWLWFGLVCGVYTD